MTKYVLEPEVAGELGPGTEIDASVHPPNVTRLQYEIHGWLGDDILESFPCFVVSRRLADKLTEARLTGFRLESVDVVVSEEAEDLSETPLELPDFLWLRPNNGLAGDIGVSDSGMLVVSERALNAMREVNLANCDIEEFDESTANS